MAKKKESVSQQNVAAATVKTPYGEFNTLVFRDKGRYDTWFEAVARLLGDDVVPSYGSVVNFKGMIVMCLPVDASDDTLTHEIIHTAQRLNVPMGDTGIHGNVELLPEYVSTVRGMVDGIIIEAQKEFGGKK